MEMNIKNTLEGRYRLKVYKKDGTLKHDTGEFPNLITDFGLNAIASGRGWWRCSVGSGTATPQVTDTSLASFVAVTVGGTDTPSGYYTSYRYRPSPHEYAERRFQYTFNEGVAAGNIREVGIHEDGTSSLHSRALILDEFGDPTTITILSDEYLIVDYILRINIPQTDTTGIVTYDGVDYTWTARASQADTLWYPDLGPSAIWSHFYSYSGDIGADILSSPSGGSDISRSRNYYPYIQDSFEREVDQIIQASEANWDGGIGAFSFVTRLYSKWQIGLSPKLPKTSSQILKIRLKISWARA